MVLSKKMYLILGVFIFLVFVFFSYLVHKNLFSHFDFNNTVRLQDHLSRRVDGPFSVLSFIGSFEVSVILLLIFLIFRKKLNGVFIFLAFGLFHLFEIYGKTFVSHLPPPHFLLRTEQLVNFPQFYVSAQNSYPSGHAARALFLTTMLALFTLNNKKLKSIQKIIIYSLLALYDLIMLISRVYLGEHWTSDVIGGSLLGLSFALFSFIFTKVSFRNLFSLYKNTK